MKSSILHVSLAAIGLLAAACGGADPEGDCRNFCERAKAAGCEDESTDCAAECADAQATYDSLRDRAVAVGCAAQFDTAYACQAGAEACTTEPQCQAENQAVTNCAIAYCTANPTDPACTGP